MPPRVHVVTNIPSYHQVDLLDAVARRGEVEVFVTYLRPMTPGRQWSRLPKPSHPHVLRPVLFNGTPFYLNPGITFHLLEVPSDLVVITQYAGLAYQEAMYLCNLRRRPWVFWSERPGVEGFEVRSGIPEGLRPLARRVALRPVARGARQIWAVGNKAQAEYERLTARRCFSLPYFSDLSRFQRGGAGYCPDRRVRFLYAGRFSQRKGFDTLCAAFAKLAEDELLGDRWVLSVCGDGNLKPLLKSFGALGGHVRDLGFRELDEMPEVMRTHDVLVMPSRYEGWGMVLPEALAAGVPAICSDAVGSGLDIGPGNEWLRFFRAGDVDALLRRLREVVSSHQTLAELGVAGARAAQRYDVTVGAREFSGRVRQALAVGD